MMITAEKFEERTGYPPEDDDLERCNCEVAGTMGHFMCGWEVPGETRTLL